MQPIFSPVDHEARHHGHSGSFRADGGERAETTPLLTARQLTDSIVQSRSPATTVVVTSLLLILIIGVVISVYLLIEDEDVIPPVENALQPVMRGQRAAPSPPDARGRAAGGPARVVLAVDTGTDACTDSANCTKLLRIMQSKFEGRLPYSFLVSSRGLVFEGAGWLRASPPFPGYSNSAPVLAFIGNFTSTAPHKLQIEAAKAWLRESVSRGRLAPGFHLIGKASAPPAAPAAAPSRLFDSLRDLPQWDPLLSDM